MVENIFIRSVLSAVERPDFGSIDRFLRNRFVGDDILVSFYEDISRIVTFRIRPLNGTKDPIYRRVSKSYSH